MSTPFGWGSSRHKQDWLVKEDRRATTVTEINGEVVVVAPDGSLAPADPKDADAEYDRERNEVLRRMYEGNDGRSCHPTDQEKDTPIGWGQRHGRPTAYTASEPSAEAKSSSSSTSASSNSSSSSSSSSPSPFGSLRHQPPSSSSSSSSSASSPFGSSSRHQQDTKSSSFSSLSPSLKRVKYDHNSNIEAQAAAERIPTDSRVNIVFSYGIELATKECDEVAHELDELNQEIARLQQQLILKKQDMRDKQNLLKTKQTMLAMFQKTWEGVKQKTG